MRCRVLEHKHNFVDVSQSFTCHDVIFRSSMTKTRFTNKKNESGLNWAYIGLI